MGVVATIPEQFLDRNLRMSDFVFLDGFEGYASELPIALLDSRACRPKGRQGCQTDADNLSFLIQLRRPYADAREKRATSIDDSTNHSRGPQTRIRPRQPISASPTTSQSWIADYLAYASAY